MSMSFETGTCISDEYVWKLFILVTLSTILIMRYNASFSYKRTESIMIVNNVHFTRPIHQDILT